MFEHERMVDFQRDFSSEHSLTIRPKRQLTQSRCSLSFQRWLCSSQLREDTQETFSILTASSPAGYNDETEFPTVVRRRR